LCLPLYSLGFSDESNEASERPDAILPVSWIGSDVRLRNNKNDLLGVHLIKLRRGDALLKSAEVLRSAAQTVGFVDNLTPSVLAGGLRRKGDELFGRECRRVVCLL